MGIWMAVRTTAFLLLCLVWTAACSSSTNRAATVPTTTSSTALPTTTTRPVVRRSVCGNPGRPPARYQSIVVFSFENRTWSDVGLGFGAGMPYLHTLGRLCSYFTDWTEADPTQNSLTQYV